MKKMKIAIALLLTLLIFTACTDTEEKNENGQSEQNKQNEQIEENEKGKEEMNESQPELDVNENQEQQTQQETQKDIFYEVLISEQFSDAIPDEYNYYEKLIGVWDFEVVSNDGKTGKGEWSFSWILEGKVLQDIFILPFGEENNLGYADYGATVRIFNPDKKEWEIMWLNKGMYNHATAEMSDSMIIHTHHSNENWKWVFAEITDDTFHWQDVMVQQDGTWNVRGDLYATRRTLAPEVSATDYFYDVLVSEQGSGKIKDEFNHYEKLIGDWEFEGVFSSGETFQGEWSFSWILEGTAIQDVFIAPSRATRDTSPFKDSGEYGAGVRLFESKGSNAVWHNFWFENGNIIYLKMEEADSMLVHTRLDKEEEKWVFAEINDNDFHWQNVTVQADGTWQVNLDVYAKRI
ncbi:MAG: hypothetical protein FWG44_05000 [Oscillospiraceae bacterium]|nr:hypothetical protein [Oscillospiraceae bacterium]